MDSLSRHTPQMQQAIRKHSGPMGPGAAPQGVAFRELPQGMQQNLREMFAARQDDLAQRGGRRHSGITPETLDDTRIWFEVHPLARATGYRIVAHNERSGSLDLNFSVLTDPKERSDRIASTLPPSTIWYGAKGDAASRKEALEGTPAWTRR